MRLTHGETLRVLRHRKKQSISSAAQERGVYSHVYAKMETLDRIDGWPRGGVVVVPTLGEKALMWRIRNHVLQKDCAKRVGVSRYWYRRMEHDEVPNDRLKELWE